MNQGTVEVLPSGRARVRFRVEGRVKQVGPVFASEAEAQKARAAFVFEAVVAEADPSPTLTKFGFGVIDQRELSKKIEDTDTERSRWRTYVEADEIGAVFVREVDDEEIEAWLVRLMKKGLARQTRQNALNLMRAVYRVACKKKRHHDGPNPCDGIRLGSEKRTAEVWHYLSLEEQAKLIAATPAPLDAIVEFAIGTGLRAGELVSLRLADVHVDDPEPHLIVRYGKPPNRPTKTGKIRRVPLFGHGLAAMERWLVGLPTFCPKNQHGLAFPGPTGAFRSRAHVIRWALWRGRPAKGTPGTKGYRKPVPGIVERAGIAKEVRWHDLRHTCASSLVSGWWGDPEPRAWTLAEVCALLGHASITTTERYAKLADTALKKAARETFVSASPGKRTVEPTPTRTIHGRSMLAEAPGEILSNIAGATLGNRTRDLRFTKPAKSAELSLAWTPHGTIHGTGKAVAEAIADGTPDALVTRLARSLAREVLKSRAVVLANEILIAEDLDVRAVLELAELTLDAPAVADELGPRPALSGRD